MSQFVYIKIFSTNQNENLLLLDDPGRVRSQITSVVCQIQRFDFDCILVVSRKVILWTRSPLRIKPLYRGTYSLFFKRGSAQPAGGILGGLRFRSTAIRIFKIVWCFPWVFPKKRLELKSLKRQTKAEELGDQVPKLLSLRLSLKAL